MNTFQTALYKQNEYASTELKEKLKYEKKIVGNLKTNTKPFFRYLRSKNKIRKTVKELIGSDGVSSKTPQETADILLDFFQSVFKAETAGPLPQKCFESANILNEPMAKPKIESETVKKLLTNLNATKSMGPDNVHPKLLKFLADDDKFVTSLSQLLTGMYSKVQWLYQFIRRDLFIILKIIGQCLSLVYYANFMKPF